MPAISTARNRKSFFWYPCLVAPPLAHFGTIYSKQLSGLAFGRFHKCFPTPGTTLVGGFCRRTNSNAEVYFSLQCLIPWRFRQRQWTYRHGPKHKPGLMHLSRLAEINGLV